ncbi:hypothetical protein [Sporosarcina sp. P17b]|uniref:hypothetical protein n=1 Tax=Sporosarcina sp. P17b TaxID=2048260 RepID=UPI000C16C0BA|nr:hypothetical protein [Sporosarcina sp. P17b]PIC74070.1 hypothetical protein CSV76_06140 [Sporosarcina sp. P17b]
MIGNKEKCPCGSGEIVENCCGKTDVPGTNQIQEELKQILNSYYETTLSPLEIKTLEGLLKEWGGRLGEWMEEEELVTNVSDYYFFIVRKDLWRRHLVKALNRTQNRAVRAILKSWQNAFVTFAEVSKADKEVYYMKEILGTGEYLLAREAGEPEDVRAVIAIVLEEMRNDERWVMPISAIAVNEHMSTELKTRVQEIAETSEEKNSFDFFKKHLVDIYEVVCRLDVQTLSDVVEQNFTPLQREVVEILDAKLEKEELYPGAYEMLLSLMAYYFTDQDPKFRKPEVLAAAAFQLAVDTSMMPNTYTQAEVGKMFDVSVSSFRKHTDILQEKIEDLEKMMAEGQTEAAYHIGTNPLPSEQMNWQVHMLTQKHDFDSFEEAQAYIQEAIQQPFEPENQQQEAQMLCYMAYNAETVEQRRDFAEGAYGADPTNVDALLLQTELTDSKDEQDKFFKQAIFSGEKQFDGRAEDAWKFAPNRPYLRSLMLYGVWFYEQGRFAEASEMFIRLLSLDLFDHQGARYLAISSLIHQGEIDQATRLLEATVEVSEGDAAYWYLSWLVEMERAQGESSERALELFAKAEQLNPHVSKLMEMAVEKMSYPKSVALTPGSHEEAHYIWYLL